jgi:hypothetical protein
MDGIGGKYCASGESGGEMGGERADGGAASAATTGPFGCPLTPLPGGRENCFRGMVGYGPDWGGALSEKSPCPSRKPFGKPPMPFGMLVL